MGAGWLLSAVSHCPDILIMYQLLIFIAISLASHIVTCQMGSMDIQPPQKAARDSYSSSEQI